MLFNVCISNIQLLAQARSHASTEKTLFLFDISTEMKHTLYLSTPVTEEHVSGCHFELFEDMYMKFKISNVANLLLALSSVGFF